MKKNYIKYAAAFIVAASALVYLIASGISGDKIYYREVSELLREPQSAVSKGLRVAGTVVDIYASDNMKKHARFEMSDSEGDETIVVEYFGAIPDAFEPGASVVVEGTFDSKESLFTARKLLAKCPSKYEPAQESEKS